jgi:hypothetical protein
MGIATFPAGSSGLSSVVKSIQRGVASSSGNVTITAVDTSKTMVNSFSTASSGTVAASGALSAATGTASTFSLNAVSGSGSVSPAGYQPQPSRYGGGSSGVGVTGTLNVSMNAANANAQNVSLNATNLSGGTTNLIAGVNGAYLSSSTNLVVTGACRYEVVEYF